MIKRISYIKNLGIFQDYRRNGNIQDFKELNIIYGWNYSGKTTISRLFNCIERNKLHEDYTSCEFEMKDKNDRVISNTNLDTQDTQVKVFNTDFIKKNLKWNGETFEPILLLGEETIQDKEKIESYNDKILKIDKINLNLEKTYKHIESAIENELTETASNIKRNLGLVEAFTKAHLRPILKKIKNADIDNYLLNPDNEEELLKSATASDEDKLTKLDKFNPELLLSSLNKRVSTLIKKLPEFSKTIEHFIENPEIASWVETGLPLHEDKEICEFCGNALTKERKDELLAHFSEDLKNHKNQINSLKEEIEASKLEEPKYNSRDFYKSLRGDFIDIKEELNGVIEKYNNQLEELKNILERKKNKPFEAIDEITVNDEIIEEISNKIKSYSNIIEQNNENTRQFDENKTKAIEKLKNFYVAKFIKDFKLYEKEKKITIYKERSQKLQKTRRTYKSEIQEIEAKISKAQKGREQLNEYIHTFLGAKEISVEVKKEEENERFTLQRGSDTAKNLSEGEKTAISLSFFLTKLLELEDFKNTIVYIDDPVSSLDSNHIFQVNALLKSFFFKQNEEDESWQLNCKQLFISTHNYEFFNLLRELPLNKAKKEFYFVKRITKSNSTLSKLPKAIRNYKSEYHYLFNEIYKYYKSADKTDFDTLMHIPNIVRRFVELYTYSKIPGNLSSQVDKRTDKLFGTEKSKRIMKVLHYFSHSNDIERMVNNSDLLCDIENAVNDLMDELKKDDLHYKELLKSIE